VSASPERLVLLGHPIGHTFSPLIQNAALRAAGIDLSYERLDVPKSALADTLSDLRRARAAGNVTIPYKEHVREACDRLTATARAVGAVNTFWIAVDGALVGDNTDVEGFTAAVLQLFGGKTASGERVCLLGAGGGAAAVLHAIKGWPDVSVRMYSRTRERAEQLARRLEVDAAVCSTVREAVQSATLVVNATPVGLRDGDMPVNPELLGADAAVFDLAYARGETALVRAARALGHRAMDGMVMLVEQGAAAFERWFGQSANRDAMWSAIQSSR
jgi:shikimate dehydrogenase